MARPVLFLDVDGVLNPYGAACPAGFSDYHLFPDEEPVRVNPEHGAWITELAGVFEVVWATGWNDEANRLLAPLLHIGPLPVLTMPAAPFEPGDKVPLVASYAQGRAAAWIDDVHPPQARAWSQARKEPTRLIAIDPAIGLTHADVRQALDWARAAGSVAADGRSGK